MLKQTCVEWIEKQKAITLTCDCGTISGLVLLTVLVISDETGQVKLAGFRLIAHKDGVFLANSLYAILVDDLGK